MAKRKKKRTPTQPLLEDDPLWYKGAVIYELAIKGFYDSDDDGIGDFAGLTEKLDYLQDLGVTAIWLLPFYPSPLKDDGYDIADYKNIHPDYGTLPECRRFLAEAHRRGIRVITELVVNHTSDQHTWFQRARRANRGTKARDFYVWSDSPERYQDARIIFKDFEHSNWSWDPAAREYYWHRFYSHQPDLNFENPAVRAAVMKTLDFWMKMGVDGFRLDAIPYLYEREGTNCENLPQTHKFLRDLRSHIDRHFRNRVLLAEANQWPEDAAAYFGDGNEAHMNFHFPLMPRLFMAIRLEDRFPIIDILDQTPRIPDNCQWAIFLRNHDELTLEMVTEEERDYMYRVYANDPRARINLGIRRRLAPLLENNRKKIELINALLFSMPGTPVIYYGDEIGMGDNIYLGDRDGVRTPMQWSADRNAGFSRANPQGLYLPVIIDPEYHYESLNVEAQQNNPSSLLWWMKRLIALRNRFRAFGYGSLEFLQPENPKVLTFLRRFEDENILIVANLSRFVQCVELDLSAYAGAVPVEMFGRVQFPAVGKLPYFITLGPHNFYWFSLQPHEEVREIIELERRKASVPSFTVANNWKEVFADQKKLRELEEKVLPAYLKNSRWFGGKARPIRTGKIREALPSQFNGRTAYGLLYEVQYVEGDPERYFLTLMYRPEERVWEVLDYFPHAKVADVRVRESKEAGILYEAGVDSDLTRGILDWMVQRRSFKGTRGEFTTSATRVLPQSLRGYAGPLDPTVGKAEQSNTSVFFDDRLILKLFRRVEEGINPDLEIGQFLVRRGFPNTAPLAASLEYRHKGHMSATLAVLHGFVPNQGDAWRMTLDSLARYYERALAERAGGETPVPPAGTLFEISRRDTPEAILDKIGVYAEAAHLLGQRTGELHLALASDREDPAFAPEPFTTFTRRSLYQSMRNLTGQILRLLRRSLSHVPEDVRPVAQQVLDERERILAVFAPVKERPFAAQRIRVHGDYHLGQVLFTGKDFVIIDFEGEPARPITERRLKRSPLQDVAGMLRSFHYAAYAALFSQVESGMVRADDLSSFDPWARLWYLGVSGMFLKSYLETTKEAAFLPRDPEQFEILLNAFLLNKAIYELGYELNNRPDWLKIPLEGIRELLG